MWKNNNKNNTHAQHYRTANGEWLPHSLFTSKQFFFSFIFFFYFRKKFLFGSGECTESSVHFILSNRFKVQRDFVSVTLIFTNNVIIFIQFIQYHLLFFGFSLFQFVFFICRIQNFRLHQSNSQKNQSFEVHRINRMFNNNSNNSSNCNSNNSSNRSSYKSDGSSDQNRRQNNKRMNVKREQSNELNDGRTNAGIKLLQKHSLDKNSNCEVIVMDSPNKTDTAYVCFTFSKYSFLFFF